MWPHGNPNPRFLKYKIKGKWNKMKFTIYDSDSYAGKCFFTKTSNLLRFLSI